MEILQILNFINFFLTQVTNFFLKIWQFFKKKLCWNCLGFTVEEHHPHSLFGPLPIVYHILHEAPAEFLSLSGMLSTRICPLHTLGGILFYKMLQHKRGWTSGSMSEQLFWIIYTTFYPYHTTLSASTLINYIICKNLEIFKYTFFSKAFFFWKIENLLKFSGNFNFPTWNLHN